MAEQLGRMGGVAFVEQFADGPRGHGLPSQSQWWQHPCSKPVTRPELGQERRGAAGVVAEGVVEAHDDLPGAERAREDLGHEGLGLHAREFEREGDDQRRIGAQTVHPLKVVLEGGDGQRRPLRPEHARRMRVERADDGGQAEDTAPLDRRRDELCVREMDAVEGAQRRHAGTELRPVGREAAENPHGGAVRA